MVELLPVALNTLAILTGVGVVIISFGYAYTQFKSGGLKAKDELIATLKETALAEKERAERLAAEKIGIMSSHQIQINELTEKVGKLTGLYESTENQRKQLLSILQGMSPEEVEYRKEMREFAAGVAKYMKDSAEIFAGMKVFMTELNKKTQTFEVTAIKQETN